MDESKTHQLGRADLHVHTAASFDGLSTVPNVVDAAWQAGLTTIAITDHETISGALEARDYAAKYPDLDIIIGEEINTGEGEVLGLYLQNVIPPALGINETISEVRRQGGMVIIPHPFLWITLKQTITVRRLKRLFDKVDGIEVLNGSAAGRGAKDKRYRANDKHFRLPEIGSSDAHHAWHLGTAYTLFPGRTAEDFRQALAAGCTTAEGGHVTRREDFYLAKEILKKQSRELKGDLRRTGTRLKQILTA